MLKIHVEPALAALLLAFGGPNSLKEVEPFLNNVMKASGRSPTHTQLQRVIERYKLIGGHSPLLDITLKQAYALEKRLKGGGILKVYIGMRHWHPLIHETLNEIQKDDIDQIVAMSMTPHNSRASTGAYREEVDRAISDMHSKLKVSFVDSWHNHPLFLEALAERIEEGFNLFSGAQREDICIIFSAHSLPRRFVKDDPYLEQIDATIKGLLKIIGPIRWRLAFQSKGGGRDEWLEPDIDTVFKEMLSMGLKKVLLVPVGFVSDHVETLYDIDILYKEKAEAKGITFRRSPSLNASPKFISALADIVSNHLVSYGLLRNKL